jgi:hypothetical protein
MTSPANGGNRPAQQHEQTRPPWPSQARGLMNLLLPRCSSQAAVQDIPSPNHPSNHRRCYSHAQAWPAQTQLGPKGPRSELGGHHQQPPRHPTAKQRRLHDLVTRCCAPCKEPLPPERPRPERTAVDRGEPRAFLSSLRVEARPPPSKPRGLCPTTCADNGIGGRGTQEAEARVWVAVSEQDETFSSSL